MVGDLGGAVGAPLNSLPAGMVSGVNLSWRWEDVDEPSGYTLEIEADSVLNIRYRWLWLRVGDEHVWLDLYQVLHVRRDLLEGSGLRLCVEEVEVTEEAGPFRRVFKVELNGRKPDND